MTEPAGGFTLVFDNIGSDNTVRFRRYLSGTVLA